ncbi:MAG: TMEM43 family protein [Verrucomicrobia bacterium]|nr:TMEM43 family protein [Verrucomicrobiota bacterium]
MSDDTFTETSSQSIFGRLGDAIKGVLFGIILIPAAIILLFWNEGRAVKTAASLKEGAAAVVSVSQDAVLPANEGKLIHLNGEATTGDVVGDAMFGLSQNAIRLTRTVEMFQWKEEMKSETRKKLGGGTETQTTYNYTKTWSDEPIPSADFKKPDGHQNPDAMIAKTLATTAGHVTLGKFTLPAEIIGMMRGDQPLALTDADLAKLPAELKAKVKCVGDAFYLGADPATPAIGDQRVKFTVLKPATFSILARQTGQALDAYPTKSGRAIQRVEAGSVPADAMFQHAKTENTMVTWGLRLLGMLLMALGFGLILRPLSTVADVLPFLGDLVGMGTSIAALIVAAIISAVVIAVAWFAVRPMLSVALVVAAIGVLILGKRLAAKKPVTQA